jgi:hypothetical protein
MLAASQRRHNILRAYVGARGKISCGTSSFPNENWYGRDNEARIIHDVARLARAARDLLQFAALTNPRCL